MDSVWMSFIRSPTFAAIDFNLGWNSCTSSRVTSSAKAVAVRVISMYSLPLASFKFNPILSFCKSVCLVEGNDEQKWGHCVSL